MKNRCLDLDILKLIMSIIMVLYHYNRILLDWQNAFLFPCGYRLCEVYFVIVGYILHCGVLAKKEKHESSFNWLKSRLINLYPLYLLAFIVSIPLYLKLNIIESWKQILFLIKEAVLLQESGIIYYTSQVNGSAWFVSAMLITSFFVVLINNNCSKRFKNVVFVFLYVYCFFVISFPYGHLHVEGIKGFSTPIDNMK